MMPRKISPILHAHTQRKNNKRNLHDLFKSRMFTSRQKNTIFTNYSGSSVGSSVTAGIQ